MYSRIESFVRGVRPVEQVFRDQAVHIIILPYYLSRWDSFFIIGSKFSSDHTNWF